MRTASSEDRVSYRTCPLCEATCGLEITTRGDRVVRIRGDADDVFSHGFICPKGSTLGKLRDDPDRLRQPLLKRGDEHVAVSWDEAFAAVESGLSGVVERHGATAIGVYLGNPNVHNLAGSLYVRPLLQALRTRSLFSASTVDQMPRHVSCGLMYGAPDTIPVPDLDRTDFLLMLGANPVESNGSLCTAPDFPGRMRGIQQRGGTVVVVDPRRTRSAKIADQHLAIRPGTDAHLLVGIVHVLFDEGLVKDAAQGGTLSGVDALHDAVAAWSPNEAARRCGIPADVIRQLARDIANAESAAVYGRIGVHTAEFGTLASWACDVICAISGNLDRPGGLMFPLAAHMRPHRAGPGRGFATNRWQSRVRGLAEVRGELPVAALAEEIDTEGAGQIRALITQAGNPALSTPAADRLERALDGLEFMVSVDPYLNETTRHADVILPPPPALERSHYDVAFTTLSVRNVANYSPAVFARSGPSETEILSRLALIASGKGAGADPAELQALVLRGLVEREVGDSRSAISGRDADEIIAQLGGEEPEEQLLDVLIRTGPYGDAFGAKPEGLSLARLQEQPHGVDLGPLQPALPDVLRTQSGAVELFPEPIARDLGRLASDLRSVDDGRLRLVGRRTVRSNNSWMHNVDVLVRGRDACTLQIHPADAERLGVVDGESVRVTSRVGSVEAPAEVTDEIREGVVSLPHGYGHDRRGARLDVAGRQPGVNSNRLTDEVPLDLLSGNAVLNGIPVEVAAN
jgi:anaerobic selenocysteine-containing dehydrogenase